ncbi:hypothetical protein P8C59_005589 [Phyllachora maydis]|uniref:Uncharacterized protein n=1 Tax=Phyllachora maydis TaxID=1825666 RepID=A0AAD9I520_9PEZI|nr:hypothetical protein P8C59_005589 [Phyllachora maydis]
MYTYIACLPCCCCYCNSSFTDLLIANIDSFSDLDNSVYTILGIPTAPLALAPTPAKPAKITPAIRRAATCKAKQSKKEDLRRSKYTASSNTGRYTTNSGLIANKDDNNAYNRAYIPPAKAEEEEEGGSGDDNGVNGGTSNSADKGKGSGVYKCSKGALHCKDTPLYKR